ncbi:cation efflux system protein [Escherichia coli]|uniref:Cation efflux system protein n=1 Tax=Escherichia coli TaxID=562 RepID=A0A376L1Z9_ECOLX|nr:cation efflux system protein [Escherichia coli]
MPILCRWAALRLPSGAMVDAAIVMIENAHKRLEEWQHQHPDATLDNKTRWQVITDGIC